MIEPVSTYTWHLAPTLNQHFTYADNVFTKEECERIIAHGLETSRIEEGLVGSEIQAKARKDSEIRKGKLSFLNSSNTDIQWIYQRLTDCINHMNDRMYNFDLTYIEILQFSIYELGDFYNDHMDTIKPVCVHNRKLSFSIQLSEPDAYQGSDLEINVNAAKFEAAPKTQGTAVFFPSYSVHRVTPLTKGVRYALVGWVCGPAFR